jgi:DNA (cytosine-5)-methyltransferase 1
MKNVKVLSLFSGAGGLDLGFHLEGFDIKACIELEKDACDTLELNKGKYLSEDTKIYCKDITKLPPESVKNEIGDVDFMIGGPPCQSFSAAGRRAGGVPGINDTRGSLFWYYVQYLRIFKPKGFLFENVKGILQANKSQDWEVIKESFRELGYKLSYRILDAADYGTPQHRERVILVGQHLEAPFKFPKPSFGPNSKDSKPYLTPKEVFSDIDNPNEDVPVYSGKYGHLLNDIPPGLNYSFYTERMGHPNPLFAWRSKFSGFLYKLDPEEPSKTLVAHQGKYDGPFHWRNRKLNKEELMRIQGFPIDYKFMGSRTSIEKQIGNSVAPKMSQYLAKSVLVQIFNHENMTIELLEPDEVLVRKKRHRVTKNVTPHFKGNNKQLELLEEKINWPIDSVSLDIHSGIIANKCALKDGEWEIKASNIGGKNKIEVHIDVEFGQPVARTFNRISCSLKIEKIEDFNIAWDFIHKIVDYSCSYESLQPLYGHFTEPYPKFSVKVTTNKPKNGISMLLDKMSDYSFLSKTHEYSELHNMFGKNINILDVVKLLRSKGIDVRIHETNRAIPRKNFRICYPFSIPTWQPIYTKWIDIGDHSTEDLSIEMLMEGAK